MKENVGGWDRNMRWIFGGAALVAGLSGRLPMGWRLGLLAFSIGQLTSAGTRYCPLNEALGINTKTQDLGEAVHEAASNVASLAG